MTEIFVVVNRIICCCEKWELNFKNSHTHTHNIYERIWRLKVYQLGCQLSNVHAWTVLVLNNQKFRIIIFWTFVAGVRVYSQLTQMVGFYVEAHWTTPQSPCMGWSLTCSCELWCYAWIFRCNITTCDELYPSYIELQNRGMGPYLWRFFNRKIYHFIWNSPCQIEAKILKCRYILNLQCYFARKFLLSPCIFTCDDDEFYACNRILNFRRLQKMTESYRRNYMHLRQN